MRYDCLSDWRAIPSLSGLSDLSNPPKALYYRGTFDPSLFTAVSSVVGSRRMTNYGRVCVERITASLVTHGRTVLSGFMYGVDRAAHESTIALGGKTVAVLGWGIAVPLSPEEEALAERIIDAGGLVVSEWIDQQPTLWTFPVRNRIVAALSHEIIVVEAAVKSGSLITASIGKKLHRKIFAVPGPITSSVSRGTNQLLSSGEASFWVGDQAPRVEKETHPLLLLLQDEGRSVNDIARAVKRPVEEINAELSLLLLSDQVREQGGIFYARKN